MFLNGIVELIKDIVFLAGYITTGKSFPQPLNSEEEKKYLCRMKNGDEKSKDVLIERNLRLVAHIAKKYNNLNIDSDDLISVGTIGLIKAVNTFDQDKGIHLATYAARCIENEILMCIRAAKKLKSEVSLNEPIGVDKEGNEISLIDILGTGQDMVADQVHTRIQEKKMIALLNKVLTKREKTVIELRYGINGMHMLTQREIAAILGISRSYVSRIEKKALIKLSKELGRSYK